jgi:hypothetical protein
LLFFVDCCLPLSRRLRERSGGGFRRSPSRATQLVMTRVERIEKEVAELSARELEDFRAWFEAFAANRWDAEFERDVESGALDKFADRAIADHRAGRSKPL